MKLAVRESESDALRRYLRDDDYWVSSAICYTEVVRSVDPQGPQKGALARRFLDRMRLVAVDNIILQSAAQLAPPSLRTLDAIHVATALALGDELDALVTYDRRMQDAAEALGIDVAAPA